MPREVDLEALAASIPEELQRRGQWVAWRLERRGDKETKVPYCALTARKAKPNDGQTWTDFQSALKALETGRYQGIGFVFAADDPYTGIDLDKALDERREPKPWARSILDRLPADAYVEVSPSGRGLHAIVRARKPGRTCRRPVEDGDLEIYDRGRYFTMTGDVFGQPAAEIAEAQGEVDALYERLFPERRSAPAPRKAPDLPAIEGDRELLDRAFASKQGHRIQALWNGDTEGYASQSEADLALCSHLWFWTGGDATRVDALFRRSGLMRPKWERADYREATLAKAAAGNDVYEPTKRRRHASGNGRRPDPRAKREPAIPLNPADRPKRPNTHLANAWRLAGRYGGELRFVPGLDFIVYDGRRWVPSKTRAIGLASRVSRLICEEAARLSRDAAQCDDDDRRKSLEKRAEILNKWARTSEQGTAIRESLNLAKSFLELAPDRLDRHPFLLNVENGTLDLERGELRPHQPDVFLTKMAPVRYDRRAEAPTWRRFIDEIMGGRESLVRYAQKALGYSITGSVREQCMFFAHGQGQNGKSTLLDALRHTLGPGYVTKAAPDLLMTTRYDRPHPSEVADLRGARIAVSQEVSGGKTFDAQKLKELTGERWLKARVMYGDWFEFEATFKLWLAANHQPQVKDRTLAFWRRVHLIPFTHTIEKPIRDFDLKLAAEKSGILNWLVEGFRLYRDEGLDPPAEVTQAVEDYRAESDSLGQFLIECCEEGDDLAVKASELWTAYAAYVEERGLSRIKKRELKTELLNRGFRQPPRRTDGFYYAGLTLRLPVQSPTEA